jgi:hypothetical protein
MAVIGMGRSRVMTQRACPLGARSSSQVRRGIHA